MNVFLRTSTGSVGSGLLQIPKIPPNGTQPHLTPLNQDALGALQSPRNCQPREMQERLQTMADKFCPLLEKVSDDAREGGMYKMTKEQKYNEFVSRQIGLVIAAGSLCLGRLSPESTEQAPELRADLQTMLRADSAESFAQLAESDPVRAAAYAAAISPELHQEFGIAVTEDLKPIYEQFQKANNGLCLSRAEAMALRDFAHAHTPTFVIYRANDMLAQAVPEFGTDLLAPLFANFHSAVEKLARMPSHQAMAPMVWKGLNLQAKPYETDQLRLGTTQQITRWTSTTATESESFATRPDYGDELAIKILEKPVPGEPAPGISIADFHTPGTIQQNEVLIRPGQSLHFSGQAEIRRKGVYLTQHNATLKPE